MRNLPNDWSDADYRVIALDEEYNATRPWWSWMEDMQHLANSGDEQAKQTLINFFGESE